MARGLARDRHFTIVDHPRPPEALREHFGAVGIEPKVHLTGERFCAVLGVRQARRWR